MTTKSAGRRALLGILGMVVVAMALIFMVYHRIGAAELQKAMQEARAMGGPVTLDEVIAARPTFAPGRNGADIILSLKSAVEALKPYPKNAPIVGEEAEPPLGVRWTAQAGESASAVLARAADVLIRLDQIATCDGGTFPAVATANPADMISEQAEHFGLVRACVRLKSLQALNRAMSGDTTRLAGDVNVLLREADCVSGDGFVIGWLVGIACEAMAVSVVEQTCGLQRIDPQVLIRIEGMLQQRDTRALLPSALRGERAYFLATCEYFRSTGQNLASVGASAFLGALYNLLGWVDRDEAAGLHTFNQLIGEVEAGRALTAAATVKAQAGTLSPMALLTKAMLPSFDRSFVLESRTRALSRSARTALAVERYRQATSRFPSRLDELVPDYLKVIPADPFKPTQPLKLLVQEDRVVIYSVGEDLVDNGGSVVRDRKGGKLPTDWGFTLLAPVARNRPASSTRPAATQSQAGQ